MGERGSTSTRTMSRKAAVMPVVAKAEDSGSTELHAKRSHRQKER